MLPGATLQVPASLLTLLPAFAPLFTAPSFRTFRGLACGFLAQPGKRTVCGMLTGFGLSRLWPHDRAHYFFSRARWSADDLGLAAARLVVSLLVPPGAPADVAVDDTLFKRRGKKAWAASWFHDGSAQGPARTGYGNNWVILAVIVSLPGISRPVSMPVMAKLVIKGTDSKSRLWLARRMAGRLAASLPGRQVRVTADSAYADGELRGLPGGVSWTTRLRKGAALHGLPPERTGKRGRPRVMGDRLPSRGKWPPRRSAGHGYPLSQDRDRPGRRRHLPVALRLRPPPRHRHPRPRQARPRLRHRLGHHRPRRHYDPGHRALRGPLVHRDRDRRLETDFCTGQARNRTARAVERTVPFEIACQAVTVTWYATADDHPATLNERRRNAPWYTSKSEPSTSDMTALLRRVLIAARFKASRPDQPTSGEIHAIRLAWEDPAA